MKRLMPAISTVLALCMLISFGLLYTASKPSAVEPRPDISESIKPPTIFDGEIYFTNGHWFLLSDGRLANLADGRVYSTDLEFAPFEHIGTDGDKFLADGKPFQVYRTKVYPKLGALNTEYDTLKVKFPESLIIAVSTLHLAAEVGGNLYMFTDEGTLSVNKIDWELFGENRSLFEQICLFYEHPDEFSGGDRYYIQDGGVLRCFNITFGELGMP